MSQYSVQSRGHEVDGGHCLDLHAEAALIDRQHDIVGRVSSGTYRICDDDHW